MSKLFAYVRTKEQSQTVFVEKRARRLSVATKKGKHVDGPISCTFRLRTKNAAGLSKVTAVCRRKFGRNLRTTKII